MTEEQLKQVLAIAAIFNAELSTTHNFEEGKGLAAWFSFDSDEITDLFIEQVTSLNMDVEVEKSRLKGIVFVNWV